MEVLISNSTQENETVLDPFMGVGATGIASKKLNRNFIGCEIDKEYFSICEKRLKELDERKSLF